MEYTNHNTLPHASQLRSTMAAHDFSLKDVGKKIGGFFQKVGDTIKDGAQAFGNAVKKISQKASPVGIATALLKKKVPDMQKYLRDNGLSTSGNVLQLAARIAKHRNLVKSNFAGKNFDGTPYATIPGTRFSYAFASYEGETLENKYKNFNLDPLTISAIATVIVALIKKIGAKRVQEENIPDSEVGALENTTIEVGSGDSQYTVVVGPDGNVIGAQANTPNFYAGSKNFDFQRIAVIVLTALAVGLILFAIYKAVKK